MHLHPPTRHLREKKKKEHKINQRGVNTDSKKMLKQSKHSEKKKKNNNQIIFNKYISTYNKI